MLNDSFHRGSVTIDRWPSRSSISDGVLLLQVVLDSLIRSAELSPLAVCVRMVYGIMRFASFAHIEFATLGAYLALFFSSGLGLPLVVAAALAIVVCGAARGANRPRHLHSPP